MLFVERIRGNPSADECSRGADLARLLLGRGGLQAPVPGEREAVSQYRFSYSTEDLVVVDWNSAFVYEPSGSRDIPDLLEIANAQLLEFRFYDELLDGHIARIHDQVQAAAHGLAGPLPQPLPRFGARGALHPGGPQRVHRAGGEQPENHWRFLPGQGLRGAVRRLRIRAWQASVTRKLQLLAQTYRLLKGEVDTARSLTLETTIVALIVLEIALAFLRVFDH